MHTTEKTKIDDNPLKEIMTTAELLQVNRESSCSFVFSRMEGRSFKGSTATLVCNYFGKTLGQWTCQESGGEEATWKCNWA